MIDLASRLAISNSRLVTADRTGVMFRCKDYRIEGRTKDGTGNNGT
jgi:Putative transposase